ncbi:formamidopyrimidine-DNA glycosylase-like isoform X2 [Phragmites australis]|uniref:formamidopyrimidine-DNA glycosylase-like isoform X2 n=1 Tax=Phragmites australis TaxID=29695 RepID=UPI002D79B3FB|nr:formamidopyrimidine-DNA glycosylase-like isoform X2 [Phragmites australis]
MPELPEVEAARRALEEHCVGKRIARCAAADDTKVIDGVAPVRLEAALVGKTIAAAQRKGKNLWLALDSPPYPTFQFGMAGAIYIKGVELGKYKRSAVSPTEEWPSKYSKLFVEMDDGLEFSFTDKRRFAKIRLLDNSFISGIGNWMADEVLYQARIHPMQTASKMSKDKCETLHQCIKEVIQSSLEVGADSSQFPENWIFHSREKKPGKAFVDGKKIDFITVGGRTSAYVPELQKLDGVDATASRSKRRKDKESDDDTKSKNGRSAPKKGERGAKKVIVAAEGSSNKVVNAHDDGREEDYEEEETKTTKRGRKKKEKKAKVSSKKASHASEDSDEEADNKVQAKQGKKGLKQPSTDYEDPAKQSSRCWPSKEAREESTADLSL